ncbi:hypothetical protein [Microbacterium marinilacus]|uniref:hypothetical protein n=1 Tax=Microbacterium marinilacus TaxID=415209 RepID=UPI0027DF09AB|nr:hypothetical protein [Microbacterium marinilacus]
MSHLQTMIRSEIAIDARSYYLAQDQDIRQLRARIEEAVQAGGRFVDFTEVGNRQVSVLMTAATRVVISLETVQFDARDTGDLGAPYGGMYDL